MSDRTVRAREMRRRITPPEARPWAGLKTLRSLGFQFRPQAPFQVYLLDFVCYGRRLVVEVDGEHHNHPGQMRHDRIRDIVLRREGFRVLRYSAEDVRTNVDGVIDGILETLKGLPPTRPHRGRAPHEGEGDI